LAVVAGGDSRNAGLATDERPERFGPQNGAVMHKVRRRRRALIAVAALVAHPATGGALAQLQAQTAPARLALVIGNSAYTLAPSLPSCAASANVAAARLRAAGFEVAEHLDASNGATGAALNDFAQAIAAHPRAAAIVYVCGYGVNFRDRDFVLPVSATLTRPSDVLTQGVVARAFGTAAGGPKAGATLVLLDLFALPGSGAAAPAGTAAQESATGSVATAMVLEPPGPAAATPAATALTKLLGESEVKLPGVIGELEALMPGGGASFVGKNEATADLLLVGQPPAPSPPQAPAQSALQAAPPAPAASGPGAAAPSAAASAPPALGQPTPATPTQPGPSTAPEASAAASAGQAPLAPPSAAASLAKKRTQALADADAVFWQSIMASKDRNDFALYLQKFPHGQFAWLAKERIRILTTGNHPNAGHSETSERQTLISPLRRRTQAAAERSTLPQADVNAPLQAPQRTRLSPTTPQANPMQGRAVAPGFTEGANGCMRNNYNGASRGPC